MSSFRPFQHSPNESLESSRKRFLSLHPQYSATSTLDRLRSHQFKRLSKSRTCYLDYTGAGLYPEGLVERHQRVLLGNVLGNPHSASPSSVKSSQYASEARSAILAFFDADPEEYTVIFTSNASNALRIVGESYPFTSETTLVLPVDSHNSVNGLREFARASHAPTHYIPMGSDARLSLAKLLPDGSRGSGLLVLTGQSNVTGYKADLSLLNLAKEKYGYDTLLDAAALAPTTSISLSGKLSNCVDAMAISLYKMTGYPTGVGALVARKDFLEKLCKRWFAGGTVRIVQSPGRGRWLVDGYERWEDGTINFLSLPAVAPALNLLSVHLPLISSRLPLLMHYTLSALRSLTYPSGAPVISVHSPEMYSPKTHGAVIALSVLTPSGECIPSRRVEYLASRANIHIRAGCMCNPGASSVLLGLEDLLAGFQLMHTDAEDPLIYPENREMVRLIETEGVVRVSFGWASNLEDAWRFVRFVEKTFIGAPLANRHTKQVDKESRALAKEKEKVCVLEKMHVGPVRWCEWVALGKRLRSRIIRALQ